MARGPALGYWLLPPEPVKFEELGELPAPRRPEPDKALPAARPPTKAKEKKAASVLPHDEAAEVAVLGSILLDNAVVPDIVGLLTPDDFFLGSNQKVFRAMLKLHESKAGIDGTTVADVLRRAKDLDVVGGTPYLVRLLDETPTASNVAEYARIVRHHSLARQGIRLTEEAVAALYEGNGKSPEMILATVAEKVREWEQSRRDALPSFVSLKGVADMELPPLDPIVEGRMFAMSQLMLMVGGAKLGKSIIASDLLLSAAMGEGHLWMKTADGDGIRIEGRPKRSLVLSAEGGLYMIQLRAYEQRKRFPEEAMERVILPEECPKFDFSEPSSAVLLIKMIRSTQADIVLIDPVTYFHNINENHANEVMMVCRNLKRVREETGVAMILVHHVTKPSKEGPTGKGTMQARGSTVWGAEADSILALVAPDDDGDEGGPAYSLHFEIRNGPPRPALMVWRDEQLGHTYTKMGGKGKQTGATMGGLRGVLALGPKNLEELRELGLSRTKVYTLQRQSNGAILRKTVDGLVYFYLAGSTPPGDDREGGDGD